jgi:uncharacterized protein (DUF1330 family)
MTKGYAIVTERIRDPAVYKSYREKVGHTIQEAGGRVIVSDDNPTILEGRWHGPRTVVLEFDSVEAARRWYSSPQYQAIVGLRRAAAESNAAIVSGR